MKDKLTDQHNTENHSSLMILPEGYSPIHQSTTIPLEIKVYKRRWLMLACFSALSCVNGVQWIQYSIISNIIMKFYGVSSVAVDYTSLIFLITFIPFVFPASCVIDKMGLRVTLLLGSFGTAFGSLIKVVSTTPDRFYVTFIGQTFVGASQLFILSIPTRFAATWFGPNEVSTACSIGCFGMQLGVALGFVLTPIFVENSNKLEDIGDDLYNMFMIQAIATTLVFISILLFIEKQPPLPPSKAQAYQRNQPYSNKEFIGSFKRLLSNRGFVYLVIVFGISIGILNAISTLLNQCVLLHFENGEQFAGQIGLIYIMTGTVGAVIFGFFLDRTRKYKETSFIIYLLSAVGMLTYTFAFDAHSYTFVYISSGILGLFVTGFAPVGFEFSAELTYPEPESSSSGLLNASAQIFGIIFTLIFGYLIPIVGVFWTNTCMAVILMVGTVITALIPNDLRRQNAAKIPDCSNMKSLNEM